MPSKKTALKTYVSDEEHQMIVDQSAKCGLSVSTFTKNVCLGYPIKSAIDQEAIRDLIRINGDIGRLGGLLKMWLTNDDEYVEDVKKLLGQLSESQVELKRAVMRL